MELQGTKKGKTKKTTAETPIKEIVVYKGRAVGKSVAPPLEIIEKVLKQDKPIYYTYEDYPCEDLFIYSGVDCLVTSDLLSKLGLKIFEEPLYTWVEQDAKGHQIKRREKIMSIAESYQKYTTEAHEFILDLEMNGMKYDVELNKVLKKRLEVEIAELETIIFAGMGMEINLDSGQQLSEYLYGTRGFEVNRRTKTGEPSTDGDAVKELAGKYPAEKVWLEPLAKRNDLASIYRTFVATYVEDFVKRDGKVHASYSLHGTGSFRIAGDSPNLTQLAKPKHGYNLRQLFIVEEGYIFMCFDFSSAEVKILGALCKDPELLRAIEQGMDFHSLSASKMYGIDYEDFVAVLEDETNPNYRDYKNKRQYSKALTFGILKRN